MRFNCPLLVVRDMETAKEFYRNVLGQSVKFDFGENVVFHGDFSLQLKSHYAAMTGIGEEMILSQANNFELYFEEEDFDAFLLTLEFRGDIRYIQRCVEHDWGQRVVRFYDPDLHIIEVGEHMGSVVRRLMEQGLSLEETAAKTQHPLDFVKGCMMEK